MTPPDTSTYFMIAFSACVACGEGEGGKRRPRFHGALKKIVVARGPWWGRKAVSVSRLVACGLPDLTHEADTYHSSR
jgi:hypothetical protein